MPGFLAKKHSFSLGTACAATFGLAFSLTACDIVDQANSDDTLVSSSSVAVPESSSVPESSNDETTWSLGAGKAVFDKDPNGGDHLFFYDDQGEKLKNFPVCGSGNEGRIDSLKGGNIKYGYETYYYKCKRGVWYEVDASVNCNTDGVKVGDICKVKVGTSSWMSSGDGVWEYYVYEGNGAWKEADARDRCNAREKTVGTICVIAKSTQYLHDVYLIYTADGVWEEFMTRQMSTQGVIWEYGPGFQTPKECTAENEGAKEKFVFGAEPDAITLYFKCSGGEWNHLKDIDYYCTTGNNSDGDTCSFKPDKNAIERSSWFISESVEPDVYTYYYYSGNWLQSNVDPEFGYCPSKDYEPFLYKKRGDEYYTCMYGEWKPAHLVPRQYTDPRKEGLTDEEYDVLDLPSEASVGDRVGGLLENCFNDEPSASYYGTYFCLSQNYYLYGEDSTWTLETEEYEKYPPKPECTPESEGAEWRSKSDSYEPGSIFKRKKVTLHEENRGGYISTYYECEDERVGYDFGRTE